MPIDAKTGFAQETPSVFANCLRNTARSGHVIKVYSGHLAAKPGNFRRRPEPRPDEVAVRRAALWRHQLDRVMFVIIVMPARPRPTPRFAPI